MQITIVGASRGVGRAALDIALGRGHNVTAIARNAFSVAPEARIIVGDVLDERVVTSAVGNADAVLVALGPRPGEKSSSAQKHICSEATRALIAAMVQGVSRRLVVVSSYGVGQTRSQRPFPFNLVAATLLKDVMADKERQERDVRAAPLEWTIVQPLGLTDAPATGQPLISASGNHELTKVSRADVASVCIDIIKSRAYIGQSIAISARVAKRCGISVSTACISSNCIANDRSPKGRIRTAATAAKRS